MKKLYLMLAALVAMATVNAQSIDLISINPTKATYCVGEAISVTYTSTGFVSSLTNFEVEMSDDDFATFDAIIASPNQQNVTNYTTSTYTFQASDIGTGYKVRVTRNIGNGAISDTLGPFDVVAAPVATPGTAPAAFCQGGTSAALAGAVSGGATGGVWSSPQGGTFNPNATTLNATWTPPGNVSGSATLTLTTSGAACDVSNSISVTIHPTSVGGTTAGGTTPICENTATGNITLSGNTGNVVRWEKKLSSSGTWTTVNNTTTSLNDTPTQDGTWEYRAIVQSGTCAAVASTIRSIVVDPTGAGGTTAGGTTPICQGSATGNITLSGHVGNVIRWEKKLSSSGTWTTVANTTTTFSETPSGAGNWEYRAITKSGACAELPSTVRTIQVDPTTVGGSVGGGNANICEGGSTGTLTLSGHTGTVQRWQKQLGAGVWTNITNTATTYSETPSSAGTWNYRAVVKSGACNEAVSSAFTVTVAPSTAAGTISGGTTPLCEGGSTGTITVANQTGNIVRWEKNLNNGAWSNITNTAATYTETPSSAGTWNYRAVVQSGGVCPESATAEVSIQVDPTTEGGILNGANSPICVGLSTGTLTLSNNVGSVVNWEKRLNNGTWVTIGNTNATYSEVPPVGTNDYRVVVKSGVCPADISGTETVVVNPNPTAAFVVTSAPAQCLIGNNFGFNASTSSVSSGSIAEYHWTFGAPNAATDSSTNSVYAKSFANSASQQPVLLTITTDKGCTDTASAAVTIYPAVSSINITSSLGTDTLCNGLNVTLSASSGFTSYSWSTGATTAGITFTGSAQSNIVTTNYAVTASNNDNCTATASRSISIKPGPDRPVIANDHGSSYCKGALAQNFWVSNVQQQVSYLWNSIPTGQKIYGYNQPKCKIDMPGTQGTFRVLVTASNSFECQQTDTQTVTITNNSAPTAGVIRNQNTLICTTNTPGSFQWGFTSQQTLQDDTLEGETQQDYLAGSDPSVSASGKYHWVIISDGTCDSRIYYDHPASSLTTVEEDVFSAVKVYPNPVGNLLQFSGPATGNIQLQVTDYTGKVIYTNTYYTLNGAALNTAEWAAGMYIVRMWNGEKSSKTIKVIKQ